MRDGGADVSLDHSGSNRSWVFLNLNLPHGEGSACQLNLLPAHVPIVTPNMPSQPTHSTYLIDNKPCRGN